MSMIDNYGIVKATCCAVVLGFSLVMGLGREYDNDNFKKGYKNMKIITIAWFINLIVFTSVLWIGEYALFNGIEWIRTPCQVTLASTGTAKILLTVTLILAIMDGKRSKDAE